MSGIESTVSPETIRAQSRDRAVTRLCRAVLRLYDHCPTMSKGKFVVIELSADCGRLTQRIAPCKKALLICELPESILCTN
jgi:hypothetical protein